MILPPVAEILALDPEAAFALAVEHWGSQLRPLADQSPSTEFWPEDATVRNFIGDLASNDRVRRDMGILAKTMLVAEREKHDRDQRVARVRDAHPEMTGADVAKVFGAGGL